MDASKFHYLGVFTKASTKKSNEALIRMLTSKTPLMSIESQTQDLQLLSNVIHPVAYILGSFSKSQCRWPTITKESFSVFKSIKKCSIYLQNADLLVQSDHKLLLKDFTGHADNDKCNIFRRSSHTQMSHVSIHKRNSQHLC